MDQKHHWTVRLAVALGVLGAGWRAAPPPFRAIVWTVAGLVIAALTALGIALGLPMSFRDVVDLGAG